MEPPRGLNAGEGTELGTWTCLGGSGENWISRGQSPPQTHGDQGLAPVRNDYVFYRYREQDLCETFLERPSLYSVLQP